MSNRSKAGVTAPQRAGDGFLWYCQRANGKSNTYYRCNGKAPFRGRVQGLCPSATVRAEVLEETIWDDILSFLNDPGPVLDQLSDKLEQKQAQTHDLEHERQTQVAALARKKEEKDRILSLYRRELISTDDLERQLNQIAKEEKQLQASLDSLESAVHDQETTATQLSQAQDLLHTLKQKLKKEFTWEERREIIEALVLEIRVDTVGESRYRKPIVTVTYAFDCKPANHTDRDSSQPSTSDGLAIHKSPSALHCEAKKMALQSSQTLQHQFRHQLIIANRIVQL